MPPTDLPEGRDVFQLPKGKKDTIPPVLPEKKEPILSTIVWSEAEPLVVIDGEILALGKMDKKSRFRVETITREYVQIRLIEDKKLLTLTLSANRPEELGTSQVKQVESTQTEENY